MHIYIYIYTCIYVSISLSLYIYIYIYSGSLAQAIGHVADLCSAARAASIVWYGIVYIIVSYSIV